MFDETTLHIYITNSKGNKVYIGTVKGDNRYHLAAKIGRTHFKIEADHFSVNQVKAEAATPGISAIIICSLLGLLLGVFGFFVGAVVGYFIEAHKYDLLKKAVASFNESNVHVAPINKMLAEHLFINEPFYKESPLFEKETESGEYEQETKI